MVKKVSIKDIANKVGVSTALVSYVLNGRDKEKRIGAEVVLKVKQVARELNYQPNQIARSLRKGSTNTLGLIVADIANPFFAHLARIIEDEATSYNYVVMIGSSDESCAKSESLIETFLYRQVDGFIIIPSEGCSEQIISLIRKKVPVMLIDRYFPEINTNYIVLDNFKASYDAVSHLIDKGHKRIVMVAYKSSLIHMRERIRGCREAVKDRSSDVISLSVKEISYNNIEQEMEKIIDEINRKKNADAVFFANNGLSLAGMYALRMTDIKIPGELGIVGFDGNEAFDFFDPPVTYIRQPLEEMGKESVRVLVEQLQGVGKTVHVVLQPQLVERASSSVSF